MPASSTPTASCSAPSRSGSAGWAARWPRLEGGSNSPACWPTPPVRRRRAARNGRPVMLMPGFLAGDQTLAVIAAWLRRIGYRPRLCGVLARCRLSDRTLDRLERRVEVVWRYYGRRVGLIGHKQWRPLRAALAAHRPDRVSHAISMGVDLRGLLGASAPTLFAVRRRAARSPRHCTSGQRNMPHRSSVQPRLRRAVPVRAGPPHEHLVTGRRRGPLTMSGDSARRLRRGDRQPHRPRL